MNIIDQDRIEKSRAQFEDKAFRQRYIHSITHINGVLTADCPTKAEFVKRNDNGNYIDPTLAAMWWAWSAAISSMEQQNG